MKFSNLRYSISQATLSADVPDLLRDILSLPVPVRPEDEVLAASNLTLQGALGRGGRGEGEGKGGGEGKEEGESMCMCLSMRVCIYDVSNICMWKEEIFCRLNFTIFLKVLRTGIKNLSIMSSSECPV